MFKAHLVRVLVTMIVGPILLVERLLVAIGKGPAEFERKRFKQIEKAIA